MKNYLLLIYFITGVLLQSCGQSKTRNKTFADSFGQDTCTFSTIGRNTYFVLEPGYQLVLEGKEGNKNGRLVITVLNETKKINNVGTRVVEENESVDGETIEISRNFFAICNQTGSIFYFGEEVDIYRNGKVVNHEGAWIAEGKNKPGIVMPGTIVPGARYYQEIAPGVAMDRAEIIDLDKTVQTPAGNFSNCLKTEESNALDPKEKEFKFYARGIGLIKEENLLLVRYGFIK